MFFYSPLQNTYIGENGCRVSSHAGAYRSRNGFARSWGLFSVLGSGSVLLSSSLSLQGLCRYLHRFLLQNCFVEVENQRTYCNLFSMRVYRAIEAIQAGMNVNRLSVLSRQSDASSRSIIGDKLRYSPDCGPNKILTEQRSRRSPTEEREFL